MAFDESRDLFPEFSYSRFEIVRRGYDRDQVDDVVDSLQADLQIVTADRDAAAAQTAALARQLDAARREVEEARGEIHRLNKAPASTAGMSDRLQRMMRIAQDEAAEIRARAESEASEIVATAEHEAADLRTQYEAAIDELGHLRDAVEKGRKNIVAKARDEASHLERVAKERIAQLDEEARKRRQQIQDDFEIAMASRRSEANAVVEDQERTSRAQAQARIAAAEQRSRAMVDDARTHVEQLRSLRRHVADQLRAARGALDAAARDLSPAPDEDAVLRGELPRQADERTEDPSWHEPTRAEASTAGSRSA